MQILDLCDYYVTSERKEKRRRNRDFDDDDNGIFIRL